MKLSNAQDNILKDNSDHQMHESLNDTVEKAPSDKDSSLELTLIFNGLKIGKVFKSNT